MLVLTRKIGEKFLMGHDMNIKILGVRGKQVKIGIEAPDSVHIVREELLTRDFMNGALLPPKLTGAL